MSHLLIFICRPHEHDAALDVTLSNGTCFNRKKRPASGQQLDRWVFFPCPATFVSDFPFGSEFDQHRQNPLPSVAVESIGRLDYALLWAVGETENEGWIFNQFLFFYLTSGFQISHVSFTLLVVVGMLVNK